MTEREIDVNDVLRAKTHHNNRWTTHITWNLDSVTLKYIGNLTESTYDASGGDISRHQHLE